MFPTPLRGARQLCVPLAPAVVGGLAVAIRTREAEVLRPVIQPVAVLVIDMEDQRPAKPFMTEPAPHPLAIVLPPHLQQRSPQNDRLLPLTARPQHEHLLSGPSPRPFVPRSLVSGPPQE